MEREDHNIVALKTGFYSSLILSLLTISTFGLAMMAIPPSGPYCPESCMQYPYYELLHYFPRDYYWMYLAVFQLCSFLIFIIAAHYTAPLKRKVFSAISAAFALIATSVLMADYFIQFSVVPISMMNDQTEGIALLTQYNGHGIFIALEELGFTMMSIAFLFLSLVFTGKTPLEKIIRWLLIAPVVITLISFIYYTIQYGLDRDYRFEVAAITINWLVTILVGILLAIYYRRKTKY